jgi:cohesin complex subunit SCC1
MFYSKDLLSKKGPLGTVWVAAFCGEAALSRSQVARTDIVASVGNHSMSTPAMREQFPIFRWSFRVV